MKTVKYKLLTNILKWIFVVFLIGSGLMTFISFSSEMLPPETPNLWFYEALEQSGYIIKWIGLFKLLAGILIVVPKTSKIAILATLGYTVNIFLYCVFIGPNLFTNGYSCSFN